MEQTFVTPEYFVGPDWEEYYEDIKNIQLPTYVEDKTQEHIDEINNLVEQFQKFDEWYNKVAKNK